MIVAFANLRALCALGRQRRHERCEGGTARASGHFRLAGLVPGCRPLSFQHWIASAKRRLRDLSEKVVSSPVIRTKCCRSHPTSLALFSGPLDPNKPTMATIAPLAYLKVVLHAAKYPAQTVIGLLVGTVDASSNSSTVTDTIPLLHQWTDLSPMAEAALQLASPALSCPRLRTISRIPD